MRNRIAIGLAAAGLMLAAGIGTAAEASAAAPAASGSAAAPKAIGRTTAVHPAIVSGCSATFFCFWNNENYNDGPGKLSGTNPSWFDFSHSSCSDGTWANCASSLDNAGTSGMSVEVWSGTNYTGWSACIPDNATYSDLANDWYPNGGPNMNDTIESNQWNRLC